jgi:hypothetical protein
MDTVDSYLFNQPYKKDHVFETTFLIKDLKQNF